MWRVEHDDDHDQNKYLLTLVNSKPPPEAALLENPVDQLNDTDADLLNLLAAEENCTALFQNITDHNFDSLNEFSSTDFIDSPYCDKLSYDIPTLIADVDPQLDQHQLGEFKCGECGKVCTTKKLLRDHLMSHDVRPHVCEVCNKSFKLRYKLTAHMKSHEKPTLQCNVCSKMFVHSFQLNAHKKRHNHNEEFTVFCDKCEPPKGFVTNELLKQHQLLQHEKVRFICDVCGQHLGSQRSLAEHKEIHKPKQKNHMCEICGKTYANNRNFRAHLKTHSGVRNFVCNICGKALSSKPILDTHIKTHMGKKDFACEFCDKTFVAKEYLTTHLRTHTGDKPFQCQICTKTFTQRTTLTVHLRYHTGERPFKCECGKSFVTNSLLRGHKKTHDLANLSGNSTATFVAQ